MIVSLKHRFIILVLLALTSSGMVNAQYRINVTDASSFVRTGMDPHPVDSSDIELAYMLLSAIDRQDSDSILYVQREYLKKSAVDSLKEKSWGALSYILDRMVSERMSDSYSRGDILTEDLYHYFTDNGCERLRDYLVLKYTLNNYKPQSVKEYINRRTFYDDFLMFNAPDRTEWDETEQVMKLMPVRRGDRIVDVGCGFGFNSYRFLNLVGPEGKVYATDTEKSYTEHLDSVVRVNGTLNLNVINSTSTNLGVSDTVDCIFMSSLYHIIYTWSREDERKPFLTSVKEHLREGGHIVIVDNINLHGGELNNCHVDPRMVQAQLGYWGFEPVSLDTLNRQRYMLVLKKKEGYLPEIGTKSPNAGCGILEITGQKSLVHIGSLDSYDITDKGIDAATYVYDFLEGRDRNLAEIAIKKYDELIPSENFGGEYSALQWICRVMTADSAQQTVMLAEPLTRCFYHKMTDDSCSVLKYYLLHKYKLGDERTRMLSDSLLEMSGEVGRTHRSYLEDYILALNPMRPQWEKTDMIMDRISLEVGDKIADIGCGSGFFTSRFSKCVGSEGKVYSIEIKDEHIESLKEYIEEVSAGNIEVIKGREDRLELPEQVDKMFMCSLYHVMYGVISDRDRDTYLQSLCTCLKSGGELIVVDNGPVDDDTLPYHGPYISKELIISQLSYYGFEPVDFVQIIPQRYMLKFKKR